MNILSYLLANSYAAVSPVINTASAVCKLNGEVVPCPAFFSDAGGFWGLMVGFWVIAVVLGVLIIVSNWKIYKKAGKPGWTSIVPIYNIIVLLEIVKKPTWWIFLLFIPFVNIIILFIVTHELSKAFGKDIGFTLGLIFLPFIFYPILAFNKSVYLYDIPQTPTTAAYVPPVSSIPPTPPQSTI